MIKKAGGVACFMLGFLSEYWLLILVCAIFIAAVVILARKGYKKKRGRLRFRLWRRQRNVTAAVRER